MTIKKGGNLQIIANDLIRFTKIRVTDSTGESLGIMSKYDAQEIADEQGLDLILVTEHADPPVCRIFDAGKFRYEAQKREKENRKKQAETRIDVKEIRLRPGTDVHDLQVKAKHAAEFLNSGDQVKISMRMRGRELANVKLAEENFEKFLDLIGEFHYIKRRVFVGRMLSAIIAKGD